MADTRYVAVLNQSGTAAPSVQVVYNTLGVTIAWTRTSPGVYIGTASGAKFVANATALTLGTGKTTIKGKDSPLDTCNVGPTSFEFVDTTHVKLKVYQDSELVDVTVGIEVLTLS